MENRGHDFQEEWIRYNPLDIENGDFLVTSVVQDLDGTKILLKNKENNVEVFFDGFIPLVRVTDEGLRTRTGGEVQIKYGSDFFMGWFLYKVENSKLTEWAIEESVWGFYKKEDLVHYCIVTRDDFIDILSSFEPTITVMKCEKNNL